MPKNRCHFERSEESLFEILIGIILTMHRSFYGIALVMLLLVGCAPAPKPSVTPSNPTAPTAALEPAPKDTLQVVFLDVDQGDSALVIFPNGKTMLIDGGETDQGRRLVQKLQQIGVKQID